MKSCCEKNRCFNVHGNLIVSRIVSNVEVDTNEKVRYCFHFIVFSF